MAKLFAEIKIIKLEIPMNIYIRWLEGLLSLLLFRNRKEKAEARLRFISGVLTLFIEQTSMDKISIFVKENHGA